MLWAIDTCQNKVSADQNHVTLSRAQVYNSSRSRVFFKLTADQMLIFHKIAGSCQVNLVETRRDCSEASERWPRIKIYSNYNVFFNTNVFPVFCVSKT